MGFSRDLPEAMLYHPQPPGLNVLAAGHLRAATVCGSHGTWKSPGGRCGLCGRFNLSSVLGIPAKTIVQPACEEPDDLLGPNYNPPCGPEPARPQRLRLEARWPHPPHRWNKTEPRCSCYRRDPSLLSCPTSRTAACRVRPSQRPWDVVRALERTSIA
ncbi:hypothetical protein BV20DRAFT_500449 [Pilatotrama ljubarskyi]|nr:hypothetical protein BV20DRAFT_500449 [Pilatotrama ljubarskyi]